MEDNRIEVAELIQGWELLCTDLKINYKLDFEQFRNVFSKTYSVLAQHSADGSLDKSYVELVAKAFLFANFDCKMLESKYAATLVLTERMLNCYAFNCAPEMPEGVTIYAVEARKDVFINFSNVNESLAVLEKILEQKYWQSMQLQ